MRFHLLNEREAEGVTILTVFMDDETSSSVPWVVGEDHDRFVRTEHGWRSSRVSGSRFLLGPRRSESRLLTERRTEAASSDRLLK